MTILNVTAGTKLMALAAYEVFKEKKKPIIYCNTERNQIIHLSPYIYTEPLKLELTIEDYLKSHGYKVVQTGSQTVRREYFELFEILESKNLLKKFSNYLDFYRRNQGWQNKAFKTYVDKKDKIFTFQRTTTGNFLYVNDYKIKLEDDEFLRGKWLEYFTYYLLIKKGLNPELGVKITYENNVENEIDVIFLKNHQLHLISCKSGKQSDVNKSIYEIETLRNIAGGTYGKAFLLTTNPLNLKIKQRAEALHVKTLTFENLNIKELIDG